MIVFVTCEQFLDPLNEAVPDCFVLRKPVDPDVLLELLRCFHTDAGYGSKMNESLDERAGPGTM